MPRDYKVYADDILQAIGKIRRYTSGLPFEAFAADEKTVDAVVRNLEVIGEAAGKLPESVRAQCPGVDWKRVTGLRNILIHEYFGIDLPIIWDIIQNKLAELEETIPRLLAE